MLARVAAGLSVVALLAATAWMITVSASPMARTAEVAANLAALQAGIDALVAATDEAHEAQDVGVLDAATAGVEQRRARLASSTALLDAPEVALRLSELDGSLAELNRAARAYAAGEAGAGAGARAYAAASTALDGFGAATFAAVDARAAASAAERSRVVWLLAAAATVLLVTLALSEWQQWRRLRRYDSARTLIEVAGGLPLVFFRIGPDGRLAFVSRAARRVFRLFPGLAPGGRLPDVLGEQPALTEFGENLAAGRIGLSEPDGAVRKWLILGRTDESGALCEGAFVDASVATATETSLLESEQRLREVVDHTQHGLALITHAGNIDFHNQAFARLLGYDRDELATVVIGDLVPAQHVDQVLAILAACMWSSLAPTSHDLVFVRRDGVEVEVEVTMTSFGEEGDGASVLVEVRDTTEQQQTASALRRMADYDSLTGLPNRDLFTRHLEDAIGTARDEEKRVSVLLVDLDRFKAVNDALGHASGDRLLRVVGQRLAESVPPGHTVARYGGDDFLVLAPWVQSAGQVEHLARRILEGLAEPIRHEGHDLHMRASIGIAIAPDHADAVEGLLRCAVAAMYQAKALGGSAYALFDSETDEEARAQDALAADLGRALERDEFRVHYQPLVDLSTGTVVAVEALARWQHPTRGLLDPAAFIGMLEESGEIARLGKVVLRQTMADVRAWREAGVPPVRLALNLSARQFHDPSLIDLIEAALVDGGLEPDALEVEITETIATLNEGRAIEVAQRLRDIGVRIAMDDFGTGHSSLQRLRDFPVQTLKIDRTFVSALGTDPGSLTIVKGIIALGRALGLTVIAEGIERELQAHVLRGLGCDVGQGFLYAPALPPESMREFLVRHGPGRDGVAA